MKFEHDTEYECQNFTWENGDSFGVFGGEGYIDDDFMIDEYGIQCDDMTIWKIPSKEYKKLAIAMINHLMANGHDFQFLNDGYNGNYFGTK